MEIAERKKRQIADFYKEEFLRHKCRLECQRTFFQEKTYEEIESVLNRIIDEMDKICEVENFEELAHISVRAAQSIGKNFFVSV